MTYFILLLPLTIGYAQLHISIWYPRLTKNTAKI